MAFTLRVLSYNIHKGFTLGNRRFVLEKMRQALRSVEVDVVFLQEVLGQHEGHAERVDAWPLEPQFEFLADEMWPHFAYGKNAVYDAGHHGNAILSRYPIVSVSNADISTNRFERRGLLHAMVVVPGLAQPLHLLNVHLDLLHRGRRRQLASLCGRIREIIPEPEPYVLAGDFNDWSEKLSHVLELEAGAREIFHSTSGTHAQTYPSRFPLLRLDRIYVKGLVPLEAAVLRGEPWRRLSDHAPILGRLALEGA